MLAVKNGRVVTVTGPVLEQGTVLIENGTIREVGENVSIPPDARVIDATGKWVTPGLIDAHTHISTFNEPRDIRSHVDGNEMTSPITPHMRGIDALNPHDMGIQAAREAGFTTCYTGPGSANLIGGVGLAFKCRAGATVHDIAIPGTEMMKMALGQNPINMHNRNKDYPTTRMGSGARLRECLAGARDYLSKKEAGGDVAYNFQYEALIPLMQHKMKARIHSHRADDVVTAVRVAQEFGFDFTIEHATEGWKILDFLRDNRITCVVGPLLIDPYKPEIWDCRLTTPGLMEQAGVNFCLTADTGSGTKWLPTHVGVAMAYGLGEQAAFEAVTIRPARLLGLDSRLGSLEPGKDADLAVFSGHPFSNMTRCDATVIDGDIAWQRQA